MLKWMFVAAALAGFVAPAAAQGVNTTTGKPVSASGEPVSTSKRPPPPVPPATSTFWNQRRLGQRPPRQHRTLPVTPP